MTHDELCILAGKWLSRRCPVVVTEISTNSHEQPDAIGWKSNGDSILIECKTSLKDFQADARKPFRIIALNGVGKERYFMAKPGIIPVDSLPPSWGLIVVKNGIFSTVRAAESMLYNEAVERKILLSACRRMSGPAVVGVSVKFYTINTRAKATLGVQP